MTAPELAGAMTRHAMRQAGLDPDDPAHVAQHERDLDLARGRRAVEELARRGVELGTPDEEELVDLGRAYAPVELAQILDQIQAEGEERTRRCIADQQRHWAWCEERGHRHAANETCDYFDHYRGQGDQGDPGQVQVLDPNPARTAPERGTTESPNILGSGNSDNTDQGQAGSYARAQRRGHVRNGKIDHLRDDDGDNWSPM
jgi:hypothetical protein